MFRWSRFYLLLALTLACTDSFEARAQTPTPGGGNAGSSNQDAEITFWNSIKDSSNADEFRAYLKSYPMGSFAELARLRIAALAKGQTGAPATAKTKTSSTASATLDDATVKEVKQRLYELNYNISAVNSAMDGETVDAIRNWQKQNLFLSDGTLTAAQLVKLREQKPPTNWIAVAYSVKGPIIEKVSGEASRVAAEAKALSTCQAKAGQPCKMVAAAGAQCIAVAGFKLNSGSPNAALGALLAVRFSNLANAQILALAMCNKHPQSNGRCEIIDKHCVAAPRLIQPPAKRTIPL